MRSKDEEILSPIGTKSLTKHLAKNPGARLVMMHGEKGQRTLQVWVGEKRVHSVQARNVK